MVGVIGVDVVLEAPSAEWRAGQALCCVDGVASWRPTPCTAPMPAGTGRIMIVLLLGALVGGLLIRWHPGRGIGHRFIQFVGVAWLLGAAAILALTKNIEGTAGALPGTLAGYLLGMRSYDKWTTRGHGRDLFRARGLGVA